MRTSANSVARPNVQTIELAPQVPTANALVGRPAFWNILKCCQPSKSPSCERWCGTINTWIPVARAARIMRLRLLNSPVWSAVGLIASKSLPPSLMKSLYGSTIRSPVWPESPDLSQHGGKILLQILSFRRNQLLFNSPFVHFQ